MGVERMHALVKKQPGTGHVAVKQVDPPVPRRGEALVRVVSSGICGTDVLVYEDRYRGRNRPLPYPLVLGHECAGKVVALGPDTAGPAPGTRVGLESISGCGTCRHCQRGNYNLCPDWHHVGLTRHGGLADYVAVPVESLVVLPEGVSYESAAFLEPLSVAVHTLERVRPMPGQPFAIVGPGPLGLLHLQVLLAAGLGPALVLGTPGDERRLAVAEALGAHHVAAAVGEEARRAAAAVTGGDGFPVVIEAAGTPSAVQTALDIAGSKGTLVCTGLARHTEIDVLQIVRKDLVWTGVIASVRRHFLDALDLIKGGRVHPERLITHRLPLEEAAAGLELARRREAVKVMIAPGVERTP